MRVIFVPRAVLGEVGVSLFVAGATFPEILVGSRSAKCCICSAQRTGRFMCCDYPP